MPFVPDVLPALDVVRGVGGLLGLRVFTVKIKVRTWNGERPGVGTQFTDVDTLLTNQLPGGGTTPIRVKMMTQKDIIASGGQYRDRDMRVGPITPQYAASLGLTAGGFLDATLDPQPTTQYQRAVERFIIVTGPGTPPNGVVCSKLGEEATSLHFYLILRATGQQL